MAVATGSYAEDVEELCDFADEFGGLTCGHAGDDREAAGVLERVMEGFDGGDGGLTPLAAAIQGDARGMVGEKGGLGGIGREFKEFDCEVDGVFGERNV